MAALVKFIEKIKFILSPPRCYGCHSFLQQRDFFCENCFKQIPPLISHKLAVTATKSIIVYK